MSAMKTRSAKNQPRRWDGGKKEASPDARLTARAVVAAAIIAAVAAIGGVVLTNRDKETEPPQGKPTPNTTAPTATAPSSSQPEPTVAPSGATTRTAHWRFWLAKNEAVRLWYGVTKPFVKSMSDGKGGDIQYLGNEEQLYVMHQTRSTLTQPTYGECLKAARMTDDLIDPAQLGPEQIICRAEEHTFPDARDIVTYLRVTDARQLPRRVQVEVWFEYRPPAA